MMKRLLHYELKKLYKDKVVLALVVLALILQCLLTFFALDNGDKPDTEIMKRAYDLYSNDRELFETRKGELEKAIISNGGEINVLMFEYYAIVSAETDAGLPQDYRKEIDALIKNAKRQADEYESIGVPEKAYSRKSFSNTVEIYTPLRDADIKYEYVHGWDKYFSLDFVNVFILALVVLITARIMSYEKISNSASVVNTTANGVNTFYASKLIIAFTVAAASAILLSLVSILQTALTLGFSSASNSVHVLEAFRLAPFECGILGLLIKSFLLKLLCAIGVAALTVFVYSVTRSSAFAVLISGAVIGADFVFELRGGLRFLASSGSSLARYYPISIFNRCFDLVVVSVSAATIITILLFVFAFNVLCRIRNVGMPKAKINLPRLRIPKNRFTFELYKLNIKEKAALIIILALAVHAAVCFAAYIPDDSSTEYFYKKYSERFCGEVDYSKMADIQAEYNLQVYYSTLDIREIDESTSAEERDAINKNIVLSAYKLPAIEHVLSNARRVSTLSGAELIYD
ncbi:MAG: hypothetical protein KBS44_04270, partial [Clostridiales bacterium]|nr:hypothetical protein [Candidatus Coliplasma equi]